MSKSYRVAILGATGAVGTELLELLESRNFPLAELKLLASPRSAGKTLRFKGEEIQIEAVSDRSLASLDIVLASAGGSISKTWASVAVEKGAVKNFFDDRDNQGTTEDSKSQKCPSKIKNFQFNIQ